MSRLFLSFARVNLRAIASLVGGLSLLLVLNAAAKTFFDVWALAKFAPVAVAFAFGVMFLVLYPIWLIRVFREARRRGQSLREFVLGPDFHDFLSDHSKALDSKKE